MITVRYIKLHSISENGVFDVVSVLCRYGLLLASLTATSIPAALLSPADQNAIEQQQKALLEQTQQQRDMLRHATSAPLLPEAATSEPTGQCFQLRHIRLENVTVLPLSAVRKLTTVPVPGCMTLPDIRQREREVTGLSFRGFITSRAGCRNRIFPAERWLLP